MFERRKNRLIETVLLSSQRYVWVRNIKKNICNYARRLAPLNLFKPSSKIFYWPFKGGTSFVDLLCFSVLRLFCLCARLLICALWSPVGKGLTSRLSFVVSNCELVIFPLVSWVRCGT